MKAVVYGAEWRGLWHWYLSMDASLQTDLMYWLYRDPSIRLWRAGEPLPWSQAVAEVDRRNRALKTPWPFPAGRLPDLRDADRGNGVMKAGGAGGSWSAEGAASAERRSVHLDKLAEWMRGKSLLAEEFVSLLDSLEGAMREPGGEGSGEREYGRMGNDWIGLAQWAYLHGVIAYGASVETDGWRRRMPGRRRAVCRRCGASGKLLKWTYCASCEAECPYCERCLTMGRARSCTPLLLGTDRGQIRSASYAAASNAFALPDLKLSSAQQEASAEGVKFILAGNPGSTSAIRPYLIWAVTGAGKTEMIFPLIAAERGRGGRVLIATPRKDVVLELLPRLQAAFPHEYVIGLYGGSAERWTTADLVVATTHQLFRYEAAFDLVVLDEIDAFPYDGDPMLAYAARKACKPGAAFVMLSATPPPKLQRAARAGKLPCVKVPVRYHRHPLPVPALRSPGRLTPLLRQSLERGAQAFVFVPQIARLKPELARLRQALAGLCEPARIEATSSQDPMREEKVRRLRTGDIRILLATTILERGVTIPKADVYVLGADSRLFDAAALIQMAGRAGRSAEDPCGQVAFLAKQRTRAQISAVRQIRAMNRLARRQGYLLRDGRDR